MPRASGGERIRTDAVFSGIDWRSAFPFRRERHRKCWARPLNSFLLNSLLWGALTAWPFARILGRAGLPRAAALLAFVPLVGQVALLGLLALKAWPTLPPAPPPPRPKPRSF